MRKGFTAWLLSIIMIVILASVTACGPNDPSKPDGNVTTIRVDLHGWTPTENSTATADQIAFNSPKFIAKEFEELYDNKVKIEWVRDKNLSMSVNDVAQYFSLAAENGKCPSIAFSWGTTFQDRDWLVDLTPYLQETNQYETAIDLAGKKWQESFEDYIWDLSQIKTYDDKIVAVPLTLFAGSANTIFYNTQLVTQLGYSEVANPSTPEDYDFGIETPVDWTTYMDLVGDAISQYGRKAIVDGQTYPYTSNSWLMQFNLGPAYMGYVEPMIDTNKDGNISGKELIQGVIDGYFNPVNKEYARELLNEVKNYASLINEENTDSSQWNEGLGVLKYSGSWSYTPEKTANRSFNWEMIPAPVKNDTEYTQNSVEWVSFDEAQPGVDLYVNIMKAGVTKNGKFDGEIDEEKLFYSVEFLKYLTTREANSAMIDEMNTSLGAVKGAVVPSWLENSAYRRCQFAKTTNVAWPIGFTTAQRTELDTLISTWIRGTYAGTDEDFYVDWNALQVKGARAMAQSLGIQIEG